MGILENNLEAVHQEIKTGRYKQLEDVCFLKPAKSICRRGSKSSAAPHDSIFITIAVFVTSLHQAISDLKRSEYS